MRMRAGLLAMTLAGTLWAGAPQPVWQTAEVEGAEFAFRLIQDTSDIQSLLGTDLDREFILVEFRVTPLSGDGISLNRRHFMMRSTKDNDTSYAQSPTRIEGGAVLVLGQKAGTGGTPVYGQERDPVFVGGMPGTGTQPRRLGTPGAGIVGSGTTPNAEAAVDRVDAAAKPTLSRLEDMEMPLGQVQETVRGYLYFQIDPTVKAKRLKLHYKSGAGAWDALFQ